MKAFLQEYVPQWQPYRHILRALPPVLSGLIWFAMMLYFLIAYLLLPRNSSGNLPQISLDYAIYPYISSIGALHMPVFQACAILVAVPMVAGYYIDYRLRANLKPGSIFRKPKLAAVAVAAIFLVMLTFASVNDKGGQLHLAFTSVQIIGLSMAKLFGFLQNHCLLKVAPDLHALKMGQWFRTFVVFIAIPACSMALIGMYGCMGSVATLSPTATCYKIVTVAAPAEWVLSITFILLLFTVGYDNFNAEEIRDVIMFRCQASLGIPGAENSREDLVTSPSWNNSNDDLEKSSRTTAASSQENLLPV